MNNKDLNIPSSMNQLRNWYNREEPDDVNKRSGSVFRERSSNDFQGIINYFNVQIYFTYLNFN